MDALIYTRDKQEYQKLAGILVEEAGVVTVHRGEPEGDLQYFDSSLHCDADLRYRYDLIITACDDLTCLRLIRKWRAVSETVQIIWITGDERYMKDAFHYFVFDCFTRPYDEERVRHAVRHVLPRCPYRYQWQFGP